MSLMTSKSGFRIDLRQTKNIVQDTGWNQGRFSTNLIHFKSPKSYSVFPCYVVHTTTVYTLYKKPLYQKVMNQKAEKYRFTVTGLFGIEKLLKQRKFCISIDIASMNIS